MLVHHEIMNGSRGFQEKVSFSCSSYYALKNRWWAHKFCFLRFLLTSLFCIEVLFSKFSEFRSNSWNVWRILSGGVGKRGRRGSLRPLLKAVLTSCLNSPTPTQGLLKSFVSLPPSTWCVWILCCNQDFTAGQEYHIPQLCCYGRLYFTDVMT